MYFRPELNRPYREAELEAVLEDAFRVLDRLGIACTDRATVDRVTASPGVRHEQGRLKFSPDVLRRHVDEVRRDNSGPNAEREPPPFQALAPWCCLNYLDPDTGEIRPPTTQDAVLATRLMDARDCGGYPIPLVPGDVNPRHATLAAEYVALTNARKLGGFLPATDVTEIEFLIEMNQAAGRTYHLAEQIGISPLRLNDRGLAAANYFLGRKDVQISLIGAMPAVGSTTPLPVRTALVQTAAESLALSLVSARLGLGRGGFGASLEPFDFQYATMPFGSVEESLYLTVACQLYAFVNGRPRRYGNFHTTARKPDAHAAAERAAGVLWQALLGIRRFRGTGQMAVDEVFSPQQVIIDDEILAHVARLLRGLDPLAGADAVDEIAAGLQDGHYLAETATVKGYRDFCLFPKLFHHYNLGHWRAIGSPDLLAEAWDRAKQQAAACEVQLPADSLAALDKVYRRAVKALA